MSNAVAFEASVCFLEYLALFDGQSVWRVWLGVVWFVGSRTSCRLVEYVALLLRFLQLLREVSSSFVVTRRCLSVVEGFGLSLVPLRGVGEPALSI